MAASLASHKFWDSRFVHIGPWSEESAGSGCCPEGSNRGWALFGITKAASYQAQQASKQKSVRVFSSMHLYTERVLCFCGGAAAPLHPPCVGIEGFLNECILGGTVVSNLRMHIQVCACILRGYCALVGGCRPPTTPRLGIDGFLNDCVLDGTKVSSLCVYIHVCACILRGYCAFVGEAAALPTLPRRNRRASVS